MEKCFFYVIIINIFVQSVKNFNIAILNDKILQKKNIKKESTIKNKNIFIVSNSGLKTNFMNVSKNYLIKMSFNNFPISIQNKYYYYLLKYIINNYLNDSYFDEILYENNFYKYFYEFIFFHFIIDNDAVLIDANIYFYKSKNLLVNKGILIFIKKYFNIFQNPFIDTFLDIYRQSNIEEKVSTFLFEIKTIKKGLEKNLMEIYLNIINHFNLIFDDEYINSLLAINTKVSKYYIKIIEKLNSEIYWKSISDTDIIYDYIDFIVSSFESMEKEIKIEIESFIKRHKRNLKFEKRFNDLARKIELYLNNTEH